MDLRAFSRLIVCMLVLCQAALPTPAQTSSALTLPANRIEYRSLRWMVFHSPNCHLYYPTGGDS